MPAGIKPLAWQGGRPRTQPRRGAGRADALSLRQLGLAPKENEPLLETVLADGVHLLLGRHPVPQHLVLVVVGARNPVTGAHMMELPVLARPRDRDHEAPGGDWRRLWCGSLGKDGLKFCPFLRILGCFWQAWFGQCPAACQRGRWDPLAVVGPVQVSQQVLSVRLAPARCQTSGRGVLPRSNLGRCPRLPGLLGQP